MSAEKQTIRQNIRELKKQTPKNVLTKESRDILDKLEELDVFQESEIIFLYWSMPGEVETHEFVEKWSKQKTILLPVTVGDDLVLKPFTSRENMQLSNLKNLYEPTGIDFKELSKITLAIIPGVAFDKQNNRLGYGRGFYDKLLSQLSFYKIGICYDFQFFDKIPYDKHDIKMDMVLTN